MYGNLRCIYLVQRVKSHHTFDYSTDQCIPINIMRIIILTPHSVLSSGNEDVYHINSSLNGES